MVQIGASSVKMNLSASATMESWITMRSAETASVRSRPSRNQTDTTPLAIRSNAASARSQNESST